MWFALDLILWKWFSEVNLLSLCFWTRKQSVWTLKRFVDRDKTVSFKNISLCCLTWEGLWTKMKALHLEISSGEQWDHVRVFL